MIKIIKYDKNIKYCLIEKYLKIKYLRLKLNKLFIFIYSKNIFMFN